MHRRHDDEDLHFLAIERFDHVGGTPLPMESLFSVLASADHDIRSMRDLQLEDLPRMLDRVSTLIELDPDTPRELYRRIIIALLTGNGDLHLENLSLLGSVDGCALSPVYDPAPMRAWPRHNLRSAIPYDPADYASSSHFFIALGGMFEIPDWEVRKIITDTLDVTDSYVDRIAALVRLPENPKRGLIQIVEEERLGMERALQEGGALVP